MKPKRLKNKIMISKAEWVQSRFYAKDVKSAVEWLKEKIDENTDTSEEGGYGYDWIAPTKVEELIDKAFEDVIKK